MKLLIILVFFILPGLVAEANEELFYIGTMTDHSTSRGIYLGGLDANAGKLGVIKLACEGKNPNFLALSSDRQFLYAALNDTVAAYAVQGDGTLTMLNEQSSGGGGACHVSLDGTGHYLFVANYSDGNIACLAVRADGSLGEHTALAKFTGSGPDPKRQQKSFAHSVYVDPDNKFVYACDLGSDSIWNFKFDADHGTLTPNDPPAAKVPPGSGPRHLAFGPGGKFVYVANELGHSVAVFSRDTASGALTLVQTVSALPSDASRTGVTTAEIVCHPSGKWLYVSNRGCDTLSVFSIAPDGKLAFLQSLSSGAEFPRNFALDPTGHWLIAAGQKDSRIVLFQIDQATGRLTATDQSAEVAAPVCILFAPEK